MKFYYLLGQLLRPFAVISLYVYSYVLRTPRARVVLRNEHGELLLVQSWLSGGAWGLPGGGVDRNEDAASAAMREIEEEIGIVLAKNTLQPLFIVKSAGHNEVVFLAPIQRSDLPEELPNKFEIKNAAWFSLKELPRLEPLYASIIDKVAKSV